MIFISLPLRHIRRVHDLVDALGDTTVSLYYLPDVAVSDLIQARAGEILGVPVIAMRETPFHGYRGVAKRLMDVTIAATALFDAGAAPVGDRGGDQADEHGARRLSAAPLRARWPRDRDLQVPHDERGGGQTAGSPRRVGTIRA